AYVYDLDGIERAARELKQAFGSRRHLIAFAMKANGAGSILRTLREAGTGVCLVSGGELKVALGAGMLPNRMVINGVAKADWEIDLAISQGLFAIQAESLEELERIAERARTLGRRARVGLRINPGVKIESHSHIATGHDAAKFGIPRADVSAAFARIDASEWLLAVGVSTHVGSMLSTPKAYLESASAVCDIAGQRLRSGASLEYMNFGGGFGIDYGPQGADAPSQFAKAAITLAAEHGLDALELVVEPGRSLVGPYGVLVASVRQGKEGAARRWLMIDAGMNDLLRPALYGAFHRIEPLERAPDGKEWRVVGPICESSDDFGTHPLGELPERVVVRDTGAYGFVMASEYNGRALASEVFTKNGTVVHTSPSPGVDFWVERRLKA
ncbi:MAG TPA: diaminopimelate decarboxylase, partial [Polyangiaceae bacterium]|nr:diaminopimelate decarboxylase [Polyangiaceae bacterium]